MGRAVHPHIITPDSAMLGESYGIDIPRSLRFNTNNGGNQYLTKGSGGGSATKWTYSLWSKNLKVGNGVFMGYNGNNSSSRETLSMGSSGNISWQLRYGGSQHQYRRSTYATHSLHMDNGGWFHFVCQWDSNNSTTADRFIIWVNGVRQDLIEYNATQSGSQSGFMTGQNYIGKAHDSSGYNAEFYLAEMHAVNDAVLAPTHFGFTDPITGAWRPKKSSDIVAATTYGTGGWYLDFSDPSNLGADRSGNGQNWSPNNFDAADSVFDSPTNNFCVLDNNDFNGNKATDGNLQSGTAGTSGWRHTRSTFLLGKGSGKWYWEVQQKGTIDGSNGHIAGLAHQNYWGRAQDPNSNSGYIYARQSDTRYWNGGNTASHFPTTANNDIIQFAFDADRGLLWSGKNGTWTGADPSTGTSHSYSINYGGGDGGDVTPFVGSYGSSIYSIVNFGQQAFTYTPPTGFRSICSKNFAIQGPTITNTKNHFNCVTWTGNTSLSRDITGIGFQPDLVSIKSRTNTYEFLWFDSVRGAGKRLFTHNNNAESENSGTLSAFLSDGFRLGNGSSVDLSVNGNNSVTYVAWCWKAGGAAVSNSDGTITSSVSANKDAGFSIVSYTGTGADGTVGHGLDAVPDFIMMKNRDRAVEWIAKHTMMASGKIMYVNLTDGEDTATGSNNGIIGNLDNAKTFSLSRSGNSGNYNNNNVSGEKYIAYCWRSIPGYSKFGIFTGNGVGGGNAQPSGTVVRLGFKPALVVFKRTSSDSGANWGVFDFKRLGYNKKVRDLRWNKNNSEGGDDDIISLDAEGFRITSTSSGFGGGNGITYIYMAWAENPGRLPFNMPPPSS
tara:strand:- start:324 stop:2822 length:2499 start_codon:yes stop_codon:yes gene_type:complete